MCLDLHKTHIACLIKWFSHIEVFLLAGRKLTLLTISSNKFPSSGDSKFPIFKFRELQVPKFQNKWKNILKQYLQKSFLSEKQFGTQY